jgi:diacylglycerol kinase family enzyme
MKVLLVHNPNAGEGTVGGKELRRLIESQGHSVRTARKQDDDLERHLVQPFDLIAIAGGDGTVTKVAKLLWGRPSPFTIIPLGTANNLAHSLEIEGEPEHLIAGWKQGTVRPFDAAVVTHPDGEEVVFESVGLGLFTEAMCLAMSHGDSSDQPEPEERFDRDFRLLRRMADTLPSSPCVIHVDDQKIEEPIVLCEIMNSRQVGSRLVLAPEADMGDGLLDLVLVTEKDRPLLRRFLHRDHSEDHPPHLPVHRGRQFRIASTARRIHVADSIKRFRARKDPWELEVTVQPAALQVLVPRGKPTRSRKRNVKRKRSAGV